MKTVSVAEAKARLPALLQAAEAGERVVITRHGRPIAEMRAVSEARKVVTSESLDWLAERRKALPVSQTSSAALIRAIRDEVDA